MEHIECVFVQGKANEYAYTPGNRFPLPFSSEGNCQYDLIPCNLKGYGNLVWLQRTENLKSFEIRNYNQILLFRIGKISLVFTISNRLGSMLF